MKLSRRSLIYGAAALSLISRKSEARLLHGGSPSVFVAEGDSISSDAFMIGFVGTKAYPGLYSALRPNVGYHDLAVSGNTLANLQTRSPLPESYEGGGKNVLSVLIGHNDIVGGYTAVGGGTRAGWLTALSGYLDARRAAGLKVVLCTILPSTVTGGSIPGGNFNTERNGVNATLVTWVGLHCDSLCDFAADPTMGPDAAASNTSLYADGTHPTTLGNSNLEAIIQPVLDGLL